MLGDECGSETEGQLRVIDHFAVCKLFSAAVFKGELELETFTGSDLIDGKSNK